MPWRMTTGTCVLGLAMGVAGCTTARLAPIPVTPPRTPIAGNHPPTVTAKAEQTTVAPGAQVTILAEAYDPDGDTLAIRWSAPSGTFNNPTGTNTYWTAPQTPGPVTFTISADDGRGGVTTATVTVTVGP
jgi:hypothetical protein